MPRNAAQTTPPLESGGVPPDTAAVRSLMAAGLFKRAVEAAKDVHRRQPTPPAEELLLVMRGAGLRPIGKALD